MINFQIFLWRNEQWITEGKAVFLNSNAQNHIEVGIYFKKKKLKQDNGSQIGVLEYVNFT